MKELLDFVKEQSFLKMGEYSFSPLMELSAGISLEYCKKICEDKCLPRPLFICFPEKQSSSLWMAISILTNYYFEDYINNEVEGITFKRGEKVKIFNCIGEIEKISGGTVYLKFKDQGGIPINKLRSQLSKVSSNRSLSLKRKFSRNFIENKNKRNPISKILIPGDAESINQNNLDSKVLLIAGRGNVKNKYRLLSETEIYETSLSKIYPENKNLIIKPDLKSFAEIFDGEELNKFSDFKSQINRLLDTVNIEDAKNSLKVISEKLEKASGISEELDELILTFFNDYSYELVTEIEFLEYKYPGIQEQLPSNIRAVVINDIHQINEYPKTIIGFLKNKIPVIFISNRNIKNNSDLDLYDRLFKNNPEYFRINWNRQKIKEIIGLTDETDYIDKRLWLQCKRYAVQTISIDVVEGCELDTLIPELLRSIKEMDEFEILQKSFFQNFYPALFSLKNSIKSNKYVDDLIEAFNLTYLSVRNNIPIAIANNFERAIFLALDFQNNIKHFEINDEIFAQILPRKSGVQLYIPNEADEANTTTQNKNKIIFTGHPYSEYSGKYLLNATCVDFVKEIKILCWPHEAAQTFSYLKRRISAGYFTDNIKEIIDFDEKHILKDEGDFNKEISKFFKLNRIIDIEENEEDLEYIHLFKYKGYGVQKDKFNDFTVKCDILNFTDGSFLFLLHRSRILAQTEDSNGKLKISQRALNELSIGDNIFKYIKDRQALRSMAKSSNVILAHLQKLEGWKEILEEVYTIKCNSNLNFLQSYLEKTKIDHELKDGNPSISSIRNWLFDDEFLKPEDGNLRIILLANNESEIEAKLKELNDSYQQVVAYTISLSSKIKKEIKKQVTRTQMVDDELKLLINGSDIVVESRKISSIDKNNIEVDYRNTRKILC